MSSNCASPISTGRRRARRVREKPPRDLSPSPSGCWDALYTIWNTLLHRRPRHVFHYRDCPVGPLSRAVIRQRRASDRAGRHPCAHLGLTGVSPLRRDDDAPAGGLPSTIGAILPSHVDETSAHYAKVDIDLLQHVARPWPEGAYVIQAVETYLAVVERRTLSSMPWSAICTAWHLPTAQATPRCHPHRDRVAEARHLGTPTPNRLSVSSGSPALGHAEDRAMRCHRTAVLMATAATDSVPHSRGDLQASSHRHPSRGHRTRAPHTYRTLAWLSGP